MVTVPGFGHHDHHLSREVDLAFTTWSALLTTLKDALADGSWATQSFEVDGMKKTYRSIDEFMALYKEVERRANVDAGTGGPQFIGMRVNRG